VHTMRKLIALALMALALAFVAVGCGKKAAETTPAATETPMSTDSTAMGSMDSSSTMTDTTAAAH
jgi:multisubunit Na+/H+ antiporter MnhC subunit